MARKICKCVKTGKVMALLGAEHAAAMHKKLDAKWPRRDWRIHMREEHDFLFPHLPRHVVRRLEADHVQMENWMAAYGEDWLDIPEIADFVEKHAEYEDDVTVEYLGHLVADDEPETTAAGLRRDLLRHRASARGMTLQRARRMF